MFWRDVWRIINRSDTATYCSDGGVHIRHKSFKGLSLSKHEQINAVMENEQRIRSLRCYGALDSMDDVKRRSSQLVPIILNNYKTSVPVTRSVQDSIANMSTMSGVYGQDPAMDNRVSTNLYVSPHEAAAVYSQKGLPETIINKKGKSPLLNGVKIKNTRLSPKQHDLIRDDMVKNGLANKIVEAITQSLIYGGSLLFPMFKQDSPVSAHLPVEALLKYGVIGKGCISHFVALDRWNCVHIPNWNPTAADFLTPKEYYIPFLGAHVSGERCARVVTAPQIGYWAVLMTLGWGVSDIPGWIESVYNYYNVMSAIPTMISQMSIIARTLNVDGILATEGANILGDIDYQETLRVRQASVNNPISLDVIGDIKAIERDFKEVPNLVRLVRQDVGGKANIPEELLWSSERGAFASGDSTAGAQEKQWESIKYIHRDVAHQLKNVAMLEVVNALGKDREVLSALPYTTIEFDNPIVSDAEERAVIAEHLGKTAFDFSGSGWPADLIAELVSEYGDHEFSVSSDLLERLRERQTTLDEREKEKHDKEMELLDAQIEQIKEQTEHIGDAPLGGAGGGAKPKKPGWGEGYSRLEQHKKEKSRGTSVRKEGVQKAQGKIKRNIGV
jgi:hypothetical protein